MIEFVVGLMIGAVVATATIAVCSISKEGGDE